MSSPEPRSRRAQLRAALIALVVLVHGLAALPLPRRIPGGNNLTAVAQEEVARWVSLLGAVGLEVTPEFLVDQVNQYGGLASDTRRALLSPFQPLLRITGTGQAWALFAYPDRYPCALVVEGRQGRSAWEILHRSLDPRYHFLGDQLRFRRVRGLWDAAATRKNPGQGYERMVDWIAAQVFEARPELDTVRVRLQEFRVSLPGEADTYGEKARHARVRKASKEEP